MAKHMFLHGSNYRAGRCTAVTAVQEDVLSRFAITPGLTQLPFSSELTSYFVLQPVTWCFLERAAGPKHVQTSVQGLAWTTRLGG